MACGTSQHFPEYYFKFKDNTIFISSSTFPSSELLNLGEQHAIASHSKSECKIENCSFHLLLFGTTLELERSNFPPKLLPISFQYQGVDCLFTIFYNYFQSVIKLSGSIFLDLQAAVDFHRSFPKPIIRRPSIARKRLLRKRFKSYYAVNSYTGSDTNSFSKTDNKNKQTRVLSSTFASRISHILQTPLAVDLLNIVDMMCDGSGQYQSPSVDFKLVNRSE